MYMQLNTNLDLFNTDVYRFDKHAFFIEWQTKQ